MTKEETIIQFDKVLSKIPEGIKERFYLYIGNSEFNEREYKGFPVKRIKQPPKKNITLTKKFHK